MTVTKDQFLKMHNDDKKDGFIRWMQEPAAKALISTIHPSEHLVVLLQSAFESGFGSGSVSTTISFLTHVVGPRP